MSKKITYLLGAGASIGAIPIVGSFNDAFLKFAGNFEVNYHGSDNNICKDLHQCAQDVAAHSTVDTYARMLYFTGESEKLQKLKYFLALYFFWEQHSKPHDKRYDLFLAAILGGDPGRPKLPTNIRVLSWNYDNQVELSACKFFKADSVGQLRKHVPIYPAYENVEMKPSFYRNGFLFHKLNGSADLTVDDMKRKVVGVLNLNSKNQTVVQNDPHLLEYLKVYRSQIHRTMLHYSWEEETEISYYRDEAFNSIKGTEILVVIGYSFPTFNRIMDKTILSKMSDTLEKVYVQAPQDDVNESITRIKALSSGELEGMVHPITSLNEFYIPFEFEGVY